MKTRPVEAELLHAAWLTRGEANSRFSQFYEKRPKKVRSHPETRERKLRSGVNWQRAFEQSGMKQGSYKHVSLFIMMY